MAFKTKRPAKRQSKISKILSKLRGVSSVGLMGFAVKEKGSSLYPVGPFDTSLRKKKSAGGIHQSQLSCREPGMSVKGFGENDSYPRRLDIRTPLIAKIGVLTERIKKEKVKNPKLDLSNIKFVIPAQPSRKSEIIRQFTLITRYLQLGIKKEDFQAAHEREIIERYEQLNEEERKRAYQTLKEEMKGF